MRKSIIIIQCFIVCGFDSKNVFVFLAKIGTCTEAAKFYFQEKQLSSKSAEISLSDAILTGLSPHVTPLGFAVIGTNMLIYQNFQVFELLETSFLKSRSDLKKSFL